MDKRSKVNTAALCGQVTSKPEYSHSCHGRDYYAFTLTVARLSGAEDSIIVIAEKSVLESAELVPCSAVRVCGELRSHNNRSSEGNKLKIFIYAFDIELCDEDSENTVELTGSVCKAPRLRTTPLGREICDLLLAVNRPFGHSDYLPCICWGQLAHEAAELSVGDEINLHGRIQSRQYIKNLDGERVLKTAYEVSVMEME